MVKLCKFLDLSAGSQSKYSQQQEAFLEFCSCFGFDPFNLTEEELSMAAVHYAMGHTVHSVPGFMSAIQKLYDLSSNGPLPRGPVFHMALKGLRRLLLPADEVVRSRALELHDLLRLVCSLDITDPDEVCFGAEAVLAFFLCLRTEDHTGGRLCWGDVQYMTDNSVVFILPPGKVVRTFRKVAVSPRGDVLDVRLWLQRLEGFLPADRRTSSSPVFVSFARTQAGSRGYWPVTAGGFVRRLKSKVLSVLGYDPTLFAGYSLRRGGVTALVTALVPLPAIKRHVGWTPDSTAVFTYYDHHGHTQLLMPTAMLP